MSRFPLAKFNRDRAERVVWTLIQAALGVVTVEMLGIPVAYAPLFAALVSVAKTTVARHLGDTGSASTAPGV